jgi:hypothetical protein
MSTLLLLEGVPAQTAQRDGRRLQQFAPAQVRYGQ